MFAWGGVSRFMFLIHCQKLVGFLLPLVKRLHKTFPSVHLCSSVTVTMPQAGQATGGRCSEEQGRGQMLCSSVIIH
jgi:hypothetical protein